MILEYTNGDTETTQGLAARIRAESNGLHVGHMMKGYNRCAAGVIEDWHYKDGRCMPRICLSIESYLQLSTTLGDSLISLNDGFKGTPQERAEYIAEKLEAI